MKNSSREIHQFGEINWQNQTKKNQIDQINNNNFTNKVIANRFSCSRIILSRSITSPNQLIHIVVNQVQLMRIK
ncbi:hypothetical protein DERP_000943, partial [Dermatophagoides pteronyssinus]